MAKILSVTDIHRFPLLLLMCICMSVSTVFGQSPITVRGRVTDTNHEPLPGAVVKVIGTNRGALVGADGTYSLKAERGETLEFSLVGMKTKRIKVSDSEIINVILREDIRVLDGVVVTGYQKIKSRAFTGATASIKMQDIKLDGVADVSRMLEGRVAGLSIQNVSGTFGSAPRINIRGGASIMGNVQPLWVIDGAVYEDIVSLTPDQLVSGDAVTLISSAVAGLNPSDITDIQILKDASATSVYGARALNGVIVVTTKSGRRNQQKQLSYNFELSMRSIPDYKNYDLLNSQESMSIYTELDRKGYFPLSEMLYGRRGGVFHQMYKAVSTIDPSTGTYYLRNTPEARNSFLRAHEYANTDWFRELFTHNPIHSHTVSFSDGNESSTTYASLGYYHDGGWTLTDNVKRLTANLKTNFYWGDRLRIGLTAQGNMRQQKAPGTIPQRKNTIIGSFERDFDINPFAYALTTSRTLRPYGSDGKPEYYRNNWAPFNIIKEYENNHLKIDLLDFKVQGEANYRLIEGLELQGLVSFRQAHTSTAHTIKEASNVVQAFKANETPQVAKENIYLLRDPNKSDKMPVVTLPHGGILNQSEARLRSMTGRLSLDYEGHFGEHDVRGFAFSEIRTADRTSTLFSGYGLQYDKGYQVYPTPLIFEKMAIEGADYFSLNERYDRGVTFSLSGTYSYAGKYLVNTVINYEGSNMGGRSSRTRWLPTWNIGAKWNMDAEDFMKHNDLISTLALRTSYGLTAKMNEQAINANAVFEHFVVNRPNIDNRENALKILHLENRDLTWEKMYELNIGLDLGLIDNRVSATVDLYRRNSFDLIDLIRTSGIGGEYYKYVNFGDMKTIGAELTLTTRNIRTNDFSWTSTLTLSGMRQRITNLRNTPNTFDMVAGTGKGNIVGFPRGSLFSFSYQGLNEVGLPTFDFGLYPTDKESGGNVFGADFLDARYSKSYLIYNGPIEPQVMGGLSNTLKYKGLELSFLITMQAGNKIRLNPSFDPAFKDLNVFSSEYYNRWISPGDEYHTDVPVLPSTDLIHELGAENIERAYNTYNYSQNRVADGSFVRMKNISLSYHLPEEIVRALSLRNMSINMSVTNPFIIYADKSLKGQDPEYYRSGGVSLPVPQQYTTTLNIGF